MGEELCSRETLTAGFGEGSEAVAGKPDSPRD